MTITTIRPGDEILLDAATAWPSAPHTTKVFVRHLRHGGLFVFNPGSRWVHRAVGSARHHIEAGGKLVIRVRIVDAQFGDDCGELTFDLNASVYGVVGAI